MDWVAAQEPVTVFTTTITLAEVLYGIERLPAGKRRERLFAAIGNIFAEEFKGRILPFDEEAARSFSKIVASRETRERPISQSDAMIAAIACAHAAAVATRNTNDFEHCGVRIIDPWSG